MRRKNTKSRIRARVLAAEFDIPGCPFVHRLLPCLLNFAWTHALHFDSVEDGLAIRPNAWTVKLGHPGCNLAFEYVHPALIVREHAVPTLVVRTVRKHVFSAVTFSSTPAFNEQAFVEFQINLAAAGNGNAGISHSPVAQPEVQLTTV